MSVMRPRLALLLLVLVGALVPFPRPAAGQAPAVAPDFTLTNQDGATIRLRQFRGRYVLLSFIYTHCPDICPLTVAKLVRVQQELQQRRWFGTKAVLLTMTFDPQRDTPAVLKAYAAKFKVDHSGWHFLSGRPAVVTKVVASYRIPVRPSSRPGRIDHGAPILVIDPQGRVLGYYNPDFNPPDVISDLRTLLGN